MIKSLLSVFILYLSFSVWSQNDGIGTRIIGLDNYTGVGVSYKHLIQGKMSYEGSIGGNFNQDVVFIKADFNFLQRPIPIQGLDWYLGAGAQSFISTHDFDIGPELTLGLDLDLVSLPLNLFVDGSYYVPLVDHEKIRSFWQFGAGVRILIE